MIMIRALNNQPRTLHPWLLASIVCGILGLDVLAFNQPIWADETRTIDGTNNNREYPTWGSTDSQLLRQVTPQYEDGIAQPSGTNRPNVRDISNTIASQNEPIHNEKLATDMVWQWGQFLDHDISLTTAALPSEPFAIPIPAGDPFFDPQASGTKTMSLTRSRYDHETGMTTDRPRQQMNQITAFIDASMVYGSDPDRARALRTNDGTGRLKTSPGNLLPFNTEHLPNDGGTDPTFFIAGDIRVNEQVGLTSMHTLFVREHNRLASSLFRRSPTVSGDTIYDQARAWVGALIQAITYNEFLPVLLGTNSIKPYAGYDASVNPGISNIFSTAAYRLGHSMLSPTLIRLGEDGIPIPEGHLALRDAFFSPWRITNERGIEPLIRGLVSNQAQEVDNFIVNDVRNFLFGLPGQGGFDLASMNIQRGRDHGLPSYNDVRLAFGLSPAIAFADLTQDPEMQQRLQSTYGTVEHVDVWVGGLAEDHLPNAMVGELFHTILVDQFERLRDGDRFFYRNTFQHFQIKILERTTLAHIIRRNTAIEEGIQNNVFLLPKKDDEEKKPHKNDR